MAVKAESTGAIDAIWVGDSILSKPRLECIPLLGAIAARTSRVKLGVACMATIAQRNPVLLALQWASLDALSNGRTWLAACMRHRNRHRMGFFIGGKLRQGIDDRPKIRAAIAKKIFDSPRAKNF